MLKLAIVAAFIVACVDPTPIVDDRAVSVTPRVRGANVCDLLPTTGACSLACDPQALVDEYVPASTCIDFLCDLSDGQQIRVGGCRA